jgi:hypothetical protein
MAKQYGNAVTFGLSGKIGDLLIFSQRGGKTIMSKITQRVDNPLFLFSCARSKPRRSDVEAMRLLPVQLQQEV